MNIVRIKPSTGGQNQNINELAVSVDQRTINLSTLASGASRSFRFDRVFTPSYPISSLYESACLSIVEDVLYRRRSMGIVVIGLSGSGKTYAAIAIVRRALLFALQKSADGSAVTLRAIYLNELAPMQEQMILEQSFYKADDTVALEKALGRAVQEYARIQNQNSGLLLHVQVRGSTTELKVLDVSSQQLAFSQALHKHVTTRSLLALRESKMLQHLRSIYLSENKMCTENQILIMSCIDYDIVYNTSKYNDTIRQLTFAETLHYARQIQTATIGSILGLSHPAVAKSAADMFTGLEEKKEEKQNSAIAPSVDIAVHQETVSQALRVQTALQEKLKAVKNQLSLTEGALSEEKARNGLRESELQAEIVGLQSKLESLLAKNFSLEQENKLLRDELARFKVATPPSNLGARHNTVRFLHQLPQAQSVTESTTTIRPLSAQAGPINQAASTSGTSGTYRPRPAVAMGLSLPQSEDEFDAFLLHAATVNRELKNRGSVGF